MIVRGRHLGTRWNSGTGSLSSAVGSGILYVLDGQAMSQWTMAALPSPTLTLCWITAHRRR